MVSLGGWQLEMKLGLGQGPEQLGHRSSKPGELQTITLQLLHLTNEKKQAQEVNDLPTHLAKRSQSWDKNSGVPPPAPESGQYLTKSNAWTTKAVLLIMIGNQH